MKKLAPRKQLRLDRHTIRSLTPHEARAAMGGTELLGRPTTTAGWICPSLICTEKEE